MVRYLAFIGHMDLGGLREADVMAFLQHLAVERRVMASTQNQALNALAFFYQYIVQQPLGTLSGWDAFGSSPRESAAGRDDERGGKQRGWGRCWGLACRGCAIEHTLDGYSAYFFRRSASSIYIYGTRR